jgi:hypothetical protein
MIHEGDIFDSKNDGKFKVVEYVTYKKIKIQFLETGYETWTQGIRVTDGSIKDRLRPSVHGIGYIGEGSYSSGRGAKHRSNPVYDLWEGILSRCYNSKESSYRYYKDCTVCDEWLNFQNFAKWFDKNRPDDFEFGKYHIDKDTIKPGNKVYHPDLCCFLTAQENSSRALVTQKATLRRVRLESPDGKRYKFTKIKRFGKKYGISDTTLRRAIKKHSQYFAGGWKVLSVEEIDIEEYIKHKV